MAGDLFHLSWMRCLDQSEFVSPVVLAASEAAALLEASEGPI